MTAQTALVQARAAAQSRMVDTCTITRTSVSSGTFNPTTGARPAPTPTAVYSGVCFVAEKRIQNPSATGVADDFPIEEVASLFLPATCPQINRDDIVVLTAAPDHPQDVGRRFRITSFNPGTQKKARSFQMSGVIG